MSLYDINTNINIPIQIFTEENFSASRWVIESIEKQKLSIIGIDRTIGATLVRPYLDTSGEPGALAGGAGGGGGGLLPCALRRRRSDR